MSRPLKIRSCLLLVWGGVWATGILMAGGAQSITETIIDDEGPRTPWGNTIGDINGDGRPDVIIGGHSMPKLSLIDRVLNKLGVGEPIVLVGELVWYQNPGWQRHVMSTDFRIRTDLAVGDIDSDGLNDVVILADRGVFWLKNPTWIAYEVSHSKTSPKFHDVELSDLDHDGTLDIVLRNQSLFGYEDGDKVYVLTQAPGSKWRETILEVGHGEGLEVADLNDDGYEDIIVNDVWLMNPGGKIAASPWKSVDYTAEWTWPDVYIGAHDINSDGATDILLSPAEPTGDSYRISWFESPAGNSSAWVEHFVESDIESVHHSIGAGDFNGDGYADIFSAKMNQGDDPDEVKVYLNDGDHESWQKVILSDSGSHSLQVVDLDDDRDAEAVGTNWEFDDYGRDYPVSMWDFTRRSPGDWRRHVIGDNGPWSNLFVYVADLDGDRFADIVAGRSWFKNPGAVRGHWRRYKFPNGLSTALFLEDFDGDGNIDVFGSAWDGLLSEPGYLLRAKAKLFGDGYPGSGDGGKFVWARNDGSGEFQLYDNIEPVEGDFLQGITSHIDAGATRLLLSWHQPGNGIQQIEPPANPLSESWLVETVTNYSQDEQLSSIDLNNDGSNDVVTGTAWLEPAQQWKVRRIHDSPEQPDRHAVVDIDADGALDVVVGYQAISAKGKLAWYSAVASESKEHIIDYPIGPMSLSATDMDDDGDIDVVVGEHDLELPESARLLLYSNLDGEGRNWHKSVIARGDEHHCGALTIDLDQDGDKDIVSIGWGHSNILVYENLRVE